MTKLIHLSILFIALFVNSIDATAYGTNSWFCDATLRLDYTFAGTSEMQNIYLNKMKSFDGWFGKRINMSNPHLEGNGKIIINSLDDNDTLYCYSFSTLFQEWQSTEEAVNLSKSYETSFLVPMPKKYVQVTVELKNMHNGIKSYFKHTIDPADIMIEKHNSGKTLPYQYLHKSGDSKEKIDVVFVSDGYTKDEQNTFYANCKESIDAIFKHKPFNELKNKFNFIALMLPSEDSGISIPREHKWLNTALGSHFDTFYSNRYLTTPNIWKLYDKLDGIPCESIIILANTDEYGGGGIYNNYTLTAARGKNYRSVIVHEFGHSFAGLADEYYYDDMYETYYPAGIEPWEQNITTLTNFASKWEDMLPLGTDIPTIADGVNIFNKVGVYEGAGYQSKGVYRPAQDCRMKTNQAPGFCPVCQRAIERLIRHLVP